MSDYPPIWELSASGTDKRDSSWHREQHDDIAPKRDYLQMSAEEQHNLVEKMREKYGNDFFTTSEAEKAFKLVGANFLFDLAGQQILEKREPSEYPDKTVKLPPYSFKFKPKKTNK